MKVKSVTAIQCGDRDTIHFRYTYDAKGKLIKREQYDWNDYYEADYFDSAGNVIGLLSLGPKNIDYRISNVQGEAMLAAGAFDTLDYCVIRYDKDGNPIYNNYREYRNGVLWQEQTEVTIGDSSFFYITYKDSLRKLIELIIKREVDTISGYSMTSYGIKRGDTVYQSHVIYKLDRHGSDVRLYCDPFAYGDYPRTDANGRMYQPLKDTSLKVVLFESRKNEYRWNGQIKRTIIHDCRYSKPDSIIEYTHEFNTLKEFRKIGSVEIEYY